MTQNQTSDSLHLPVSGEDAKSVSRPSHTPGPWSVRSEAVDDAPHGKYVQHYVEPRIAEIFYVTPDGGANARLIAAAPDLLAALQGALALADANVRPKFDGTPNRTSECAANYAACVAAVKKATGEQA